MAVIEPVPVGVVRDLLGTMLRAGVQLDAGRSIDWYEIQLAPRATPDDPTWERPIWHFRSDMARFEQVGGSPAHEGMQVRAARPTVRLSVAEPVSAVRWQLSQDGRVVEKGRGADGISRDGRSIRFTPTVRLRRSGQLAKARGDVLYPPVDSHLPGAERTPETRVRYTAATHAGHVDANAFAVDLNFGSGTQNLGHWVLAAADGKVTKIVRNNGQVHIVHDRLGTPRPVETIYAHMQPILSGIRVGRRVDALQRIGRIGAQYHDPSVTISPHLHHQHLVDGRPVKMRMLIRSAITEIPVSRAAPVGLEEWDKKVPGWDRPRGLARARLMVTVRRASDRRWSAASRLRFVVAARGADVPAIIPASPPDDAHAASAIAHVFHGPDVDPGKYSLRYRVQDDAGSVSGWAFDHSVVVRPVLASTR